MRAWRAWRTGWLVAAGLALPSAASAQEDVEEAPAATPVATGAPSPAEPEATTTPTPPPAERRDLAAEIDSLRQELDRLRELVEPEAPGMASAPRRAGLRLPELAARAPGTLRLGGVTTAAAVLAEEEDARFVFPRAALFAFAPVGDRVSFAGEAVLLGGGSELVDADRGMPARGDVFLQYAAVDLVLVPEVFALRGGLVAVPLGRSNLLTDETVEDLLVRPAEALWLVPTPWTDVGGGITGSVPLGRTRLRWEGYVLAGPGSGIDARNGFRGARQPPGADTNADKALAGRITFAPDDSFEMGVSAYSGAYSRGGGRRATLVALDLALDAGPLLAEAQAVEARTSGGIGALGLPVPERLYGGSARLTWRFLPQALGAVLPPSLQASSIGVSVRYSLADTDADDRDETDEAADPAAYTRRDRMSVGLSFRPVPRFVMRGEYEVRTEAGSDLVDDDRLVLSASAAF